MTSLRATGLRQGTILRGPLPLVGIQLREDGTLITDERVYQTWIIATQDCDLDQAAADASDDVVELRPVFASSPPPQRGIRARRCRLTGDQYVEAQSRRLMISPAALTSLIASGRLESDNTVADDLLLKTQFKTWLGYRYDRPAVPPEYVDLAKRIASEVERQAKLHTAQVRDVLVQFEPGDPPIFALFAILMAAEDRDVVERWLTTAAARIPQELGVLGEVDARTDDEISLRLIETSFAVDLTQITWGGATLRGEPGRLSHPVEGS